MKFLIYIDIIGFLLTAPLILLVDNYLFPEISDLKGVYIRFLISYFLYVLFFMLVFKVRKKEMYPLFKKLTKKITENKIFRRIILALLLFTAFIVIFELLINDLFLFAAIHSSILIITVILELIIAKNN